MGFTAAMHRQRRDGAVIEIQALKSLSQEGSTKRPYFALFDIVGLDEGTCGRRLAVSGGFKASVDRSKLSCSYMSFTYPYVRGSHQSTTLMRSEEYVQSSSLR